jgi:hypothetical protein
MVKSESSSPAVSILIADLHAVVPAPPTNENQHIIRRVLTGSLPYSSTATHRLASGNGLLSQTGTRQNIVGFGRRSIRLLHFRIELFFVICLHRRVSAVSNYFYSRRWLLFSEYRELKTGRGAPCRTIIWFLHLI